MKIVLRLFSIFLIYAIIGNSMLDQGNKKTDTYNEYPSPQEVNDESDFDLDLIYEGFYNQNSRSDLHYSYLLQSFPLFLLNTLSAHQARAPPV